MFLVTHNRLFLTLLFVYSSLILSTSLFERIYIVHSTSFSTVKMDSEGGVKPAACYFVSVSVLSHSRKPKVEAHVSCAPSKKYSGHLRSLAFKDLC